MIIMIIEIRECKKKIKNNVAGVYDQIMEKLLQALMGRSYQSSLEVLRPFPVT